MSDALLAAIKDLPSKLSRAKGLGPEGEDDGLYALIDNLSGVFATAYPTLPCSNGCSTCCQELQFRVTELEWQPIRQSLLSWDRERLRQVLDSVGDRFGPYRESLEAVARIWKKTKPNLPTPLIEEVPRVCPLLINDSCSIYESRPAMCRAYGTFGRVVNEVPLVMTCVERGHPFVLDLAKNGHKALSLPPWDPVEKRLFSLNRGGRVAPMPLWLMELADELRAAGD